MTQPKADAAQMIDGFTDFLPVKAEYLAPGEYKIVDKDGHGLFFIEGNSFAHWLADVLNSSVDVDALQEQLNSIELINLELVQSNEAMMAKIKKWQPLVERMVALYDHNPARVAAICDEQLDKSGNLLGYLRDAAKKL